MRRIWILNLALLAVLVAVTVRLHDEWIMFKATHHPGTIAPEREVFSKLPSGVPPVSPAPANWTDIASRNPFSFDRTDIAILEPKAPPPAAAVAVGPKPVLFGTISFGKDMMAMVGPGKPGNRQYKAMKTGEVIDGWTIVSISDKSIVLRANSIEESIIMNDPTAQVQRDSTRTLAGAAPAVTSVAAPGGAPVVPAASITPGATPPAAGQGQRRRRTIQTPFGPKEIEEDPQ